MWPAVKRGFTQEAFRDYLDTLIPRQWKPNKIVWHNTAAPSLTQWLKSAKEDADAWKIPGSTRIANLERYFRTDNGWSGCPHLFIAPDLIWVMNPLTYPGVHSPSWNSSSIGIEMIGDFSREDDDSGAGLRVKNNTIFATALLCEFYGLDAIAGNVDPRTRIATGTIFLHKQDPRTTHNCPGKDVAVDKFEMIQGVSSLMSGGDHHDEAQAGAVAFDTFTARAKVNDLNIRSGPGVSNRVVGALSAGDEVTVLGTADNSGTGWYRINEGWVAAKFLEEV